MKSLTIAIYGTGRASLPKGARPSLKNRRKGKAKKAAMPKERRIKRAIKTKRIVKKAENPKKKRAVRARTIPRKIQNKKKPEAKKRTSRRIPRTRPFPGKNSPERDQPIPKVIRVSIPLVLPI